MKTCLGCGLTLEDSRFSKRGDGNGLRSRCKSCRAAVWKRNNKEFRQSFPEQARAQDSEYRRLNHDKLLERGREAYWADPERFREKQRRYYARHPELLRARSSAYYRSHKAQVNEYMKKRYWEIPYYNILGRLRANISQALRRGTRSLSTETLIGCTIPEFLRHLESRFFQAGAHPVTGEAMTWDNRHLWQIDHIIPCASFANLAEDSFEQRRCFHYLNLQPLWRSANQSKGASIPGYKRLRRAS